MLKPSQRNILTKYRKYLTHIHEMFNLKQTFSHKSLEILKLYLQYLNHNSI